MDASVWRALERCRPEPLPNLRRVYHTSRLGAGFFQPTEPVHLFCGPALKYLVLNSNTDFPGPDRNLVRILSELPLHSPNIESFECSLHNTRDRAGEVALEGMLLNMQACREFTVAIAITPRALRQLSLFPGLQNLEIPLFSEMFQAEGISELVSGPSFPSLRNLRVTCDDFHLLSTMLHAIQSPYMRVVVLVTYQPLDSMSFGRLASILQSHPSRGTITELHMQLGIRWSHKDRPAEAIYAQDIEPLLALNALNVFAISGGGYASLDDVD